MAVLPSDEARGVPLRLYFELEEGRAANAEVVARASLAFIAGVKELSYVLDPSLSVQIGIQGHADGSLWEDLLLLVDKAKAEYHLRPKRYSLALAAIAWLMAPPAERVRDNFWQPLLDKYLPEASEEALVEAKGLIERAQDRKIALSDKQNFYREVGRDTAITAVSANIERLPPAWRVPRADFSLYSGQSPGSDSSSERSSIVPVRATILSPVLQVSNRKWKFSTRQGEFAAVMKDRRFLKEIVEGRAGVKMRGGVQLDVELEMKERLIDGIWTVQERNVLRVLQVVEPTESRQSSMFSDEGGYH